MRQFVTVTLSDDREVSAEIRNPDRVRWDITAAKQNWPSFQDSPFLGMTFLAWAALKRTGEYVGKWEDFRDTDCMNIEILDENGNPAGESDEEKKGDHTEQDLMLG